MLCSIAFLFATFQATRAAVTEAWVHRYTNLSSNSYDEAYYIVRDSAGDVIVAGYTDDNTSGLDILVIKYSGVDGSVVWKNRHNGVANGNDAPAAIAVDGGGNVVVTGYSHFGANADFYTAKHAASDGTLLWERRYNGPANNDDRAQALAIDAGGNVVVTGYSHNGTNVDYYTAKYAAGDATLIWEKRYNGPGDYNDLARAVVVDGNGNVIVTGHSWGDTGGYDYYTAKYAGADGALRWQKRYNGPANSYDFAEAMAVVTGGDVVVTGYSPNTNGNDDCYTAKYASSSGALRWEKRSTGTYRYPRAVVVDGVGNAIVTGNSYDSAGSLESDSYTVKYSASNGAVLWEKLYEGPTNSNNEAHAVAVDGRGNVVVTGYSSASGNECLHTVQYASTNGALLWEQCFTNGSGESVTLDSSGNVFVTGLAGDGMNRTDIYTVKYAATDGALLWSQRFIGTANYSSYPKAAAVDSNGDIVVTGHSFNGRGGIDYYTAKYAVVNGALLWEQRYEGPVVYQSAQAQAVAIDGNGAVIVAGHSYEVVGRADLHVVKYAAADGTLLWEKRYNGPGNSFDEAVAVAVDGRGDVLVTGPSIGLRSDLGGNSGRDYYTAKHAGTDGTLLWARRYDGPASANDIPYAMAVDGIGNVIVTGTSAKTGSGYDYYTVKYAAGDGALLWEQRYEGPPNDDYYNDYAWAVAVDGSGNVIVTGSSSGTGSGADYYTAKYAAADGALLWEKRYNGPASKNDVANALALDREGNAIVTGYSSNSENTSDYYTAKYAARDGALVWERRYNGPANGNDIAQAVAVDDGGNAVVTGHSTGNGTTNDYYTAKYAAADGAMLWEKRYNGPANGDDRIGGPRSLAIGAKGMVVVTGASDGIPGLGTAFDYATVVYQETLPSVSIDMVSGYVRLRVTGMPGVVYQIERAAVLSGPWSRIESLVMPAGGLTEYVDSDRPSGAAYYRTSSP